MDVGSVFKNILAHLWVRQYKPEASECPYSEVNSNTLTSSLDQKSVSLLPNTPHPSGPTWHPKFWRQGPILGISALFLAVGCVFAALIVLVVSDGQPTSEWGSSPVSMYLSVSVTACNVLIRFGLAIALPVLWWRHTLEGRLIKDLNREWEVGRSLLQAFGSIRSVSLVTLATLSSAILVLDGPLLQKASYPILAVPNGTFEFSVQMASQLPSDWSGSFRNDYQDSDAWAPSEDLQQVLGQYMQEFPITSRAENCHGSCLGTILAPGIVYGDCMRAILVANASDLPNWPQVTLGQYLLFQSEYQSSNLDYGSWMGQEEDYETFGEHFPDYERELMVLKTAATNMTDGVGYVRVTRCLIAAATLEYKVIVSRNGTLTPLSFHDRKVYAYVNNRTSEVVSNNSGTWLYSSFSSAMMQATSLIESYYWFDQNQTFQSDDAGFLAAASVTNDTIRDFSSVDPLEQVMVTMNKLLFRGGALAASLPGASPESLGMDDNCLGENKECSLWQTINGTRTDEVSVYHTAYKFWGLAVLTQFLAIASIAPLFWGWWRFGREVSFSPFEIAKAFDAPLLRAAQSNDKAEGIIASVGYMPVRYGVVDHDNGCACVGHERMPVDEEQGPHHDEQCHQSSTESAVTGRLAFTDGLEVASPYHRQRFAQ